MDPLLNETRSKMQKAFEVLHQDFLTVRTGKANPSVVENINVDAYGGAQRLKVMELATVHAQDTQTIVITPFDKSIIGEIQKGIQDANLGFSPVVQGEIIRITLPPLTEERRKEFVKLINQKAEQGKIMIRQVRHDSMEEVKKMDKSKTVSEDDVARLEKEIQKVTDEYMEKIDNLRSEKEEELMRI